MDRIFRPSRLPPNPQLSSFPIKTRLSLSGTIVVARDIAHAKLQERLHSP